MTWYDLQRVSTTHGIRVADDDGSHDTYEVGYLRRAHAEWVDRQGIRPGLRYVMPLQVLMRSHLLRDGKRELSVVRHQQVIVDALNTPDSGLELVRRKYARKAA